MKRGYSQATVDLNIKAALDADKGKAYAVKSALKLARESFFKRHPQGALPRHLIPLDGRRMRHPSGCAPCSVSRNPVPPSSRAGAKRASSSRGRKGRIEAASDLYERFTGHGASERFQVEMPEMPDVMLLVGDIDAIMYSTVRDGEPEKYIHEFKKNCRPLFAVSHDGKQLIILGGEYDFTERGIVDRK